MFCSAGDMYFGSFLIYKPDGITNQVSPCTGVGTDKQGIVFILFYFMDHQRSRVVDNISIAVEILIIKGHKLHENIIVEDKPHSFCMFPFFCMLYYFIQLLVPVFDSSNATTRFIKTLKPERAFLCKNAA